MRFTRAGFIRNRAEGRAVQEQVAGLGTGVAPIDVLPSGKTERT